MKDILTLLYSLNQTFFFKLIEKLAGFLMTSTNGFLDTGDCHVDEDPALLINLFVSG